MITAIFLWVVSTYGNLDAKYVGIFMANKCNESTGLLQEMLPTVCA